MEFRNTYNYDFLEIKIKTPVFISDTVAGKVYILRSPAGRLAQFSDFKVGPTSDGDVKDDQKWQIVPEPSKPGFFYIINYFYGYYLIKYGPGFNDISAPDGTKSNAGLWRLAMVDNPIFLQEPG